LEYSHTYCRETRFIGSSLVVTTISSYTLKITVTITYVTSHTKSSNSSSGHTAVPLELRNSSEVNSHSRILSYPLYTGHHVCVAQTTQKTSHVINISPVYWIAVYCLTTSYKHSSYCCVRVSRGVYRAVAWQCVDMSKYSYILNNLFAVLVTLLHCPRCQYILQSVPTSPPPFRTIAVGEL
jgi:hypothetical protein